MHSQEPDPRNAGVAKPESFKRPLSKVVLAVILGLLAIFGYKAFQSYWKISHTWAAFLYQDDARGLDYRHAGNYDSKADCLAGAASELKSNPALERNRTANGFLCGRGCVADAFIGSVALEEYDYMEKHDSRPE